jgi:membrane protease subunit (stomatin/prohibitin family)
MRRGRKDSRPFILWEVMQLSGLVPGIIAYSVAVSARDKGAQWQQALGLLALMQQPGLVSDVITYKQLRVPMRRGATTAGPWSSGSDAAVWSCARCRHLQRCRKCL